MHRQISLFKVIVMLALLGSTLAAVAQRSGSSGTVVPICVKDNGQLRMLIGNDAMCKSSEQQMEWVVGGAVTDITLGRGLIGSREDGRSSLSSIPLSFKAAGVVPGAKCSPALTMGRVIFLQGRGWSNTVIPCR